MSKDISQRARFDHVRYAQVWEDADVLVQGLRIRSGESVLSIGSAGDNALALLTADPASVVALDLSAPQIMCIRLRIAAYRALTHEQLLELMGSRESGRRGELLDLVLKAPEIDADCAGFCAMGSAASGGSSIISGFFAKKCSPGSIRRPVSMGSLPNAPQPSAKNSTGPAGTIGAGG
jgi:S-adenosylmethionine-diacylglycerol 3-amino-3-carboxypropyl transferase